MSGSDQRTLIKIHRPGDEDSRSVRSGDREEREAAGDFEQESAREKLLRLRAEFDNYRRRVAKEREHERERALSSLAPRLLPILDAMDGILEAPAPGEAAPFKQGMLQIRKQLLDLLESEGMAEVPGVGTPFDPEIHEAAGTVETGEVAPGEVAEMTRRGYTLKGRLLRPALVRVARARAAGR